jgi:hypothetical protein
MRREWFMPRRIRTIIRIGPVMHGVLAIIIMAGATTAVKPPQKIEPSLQRNFHSRW